MGNDVSSDPSLALYFFKLVFPDGRWSVDEKELENEPHTGDVIEFGGAGWRIEDTQSVGVRPANKPSRRFFVCGPTVA